jgi:hypothetical protein
MNKVVQFGLRGARWVYRFCFLDRDVWKEKFRTRVVPNRTGQGACDLIYETLAGEGACMIARIGGSEMNCYANYVEVQLPFWERTVKYVGGVNNFAFWDARTVSGMCDWSGFYPPTVDNLVLFSRLLAEDAVYVDVLGSWLSNEVLLEKELSRAVTVGLEELEPYRHLLPWSRILAGKRVLIVHPFDESIREQYAKRGLLFENKLVLPEFELLTFRPVQSITGNWKNTGFDSWFDALEYMKGQIDGIDFDIAVLGCGAYGFPLAAHIKRSGRKAVHLGGATQLLFGIMGRRWEGVDVVRNLVNEHWVRPKGSETPENFKVLEDGAYW